MPSYLDDEDMAGGLLAPCLLHRAANGAHHRLLDRLGIAPPRSRQIVEHVADRIGDDVRDRLAFPRLSRQAHDLDDRIAGDLAAIVDRAIEQNQGAVAKVLEGKDKAIGAIVGAVMRETKGRADGGEVQRMIRERIDAGS